MSAKDDEFILQTILLANENVVKNSGGPFGAMVVKDGNIIGLGQNQVTSSNDPTAHAEVVAIREACKNIGSYQLDGCVLYTSCEPCPMCLGAIYWARPSKVVFAANRHDAAKAGFDDDYIYTELNAPIESRNIHFVNILHQDRLKPFENWHNKMDKLLY
jgi:tRNA(Arg) A34 adenosine deaminase TadA